MRQRDDGTTGRRHDATTAQRDDGTIDVRTADSGQRISEIIESWRIDDEWWREPISRCYYDVVLEGGGHVVLFEDLTTEKWFVQQP